MINNSLHLVWISIFLFSCDSSEIPQEIIMEKLTESTQSWNGDTLPSYPSGQPKVTIIKVTIPPEA
jgi:hypothetical protein